MDQIWQHQVRVYLDDRNAALLRSAPDHPSFAPLLQAVAPVRGSFVSQHDAFAAYLAEAEQRGALDDPLYRWTKAVLDDPAKRQVHMRVFAIRVAGAELYDAETADTLERALRPLIGGVITDVSRHDSNPANTMPVPREFGGSGR